MVYQAWPSFCFVSNQHLFCFSGLNIHSTLLFLLLSISPAILPAIYSSYYSSYTMGSIPVSGFDVYSEDMQLRRPPVFYQVTMAERLNTTEPWGGLHQQENASQVYYSPVDIPELLQAERNDLDLLGWPTEPHIYPSSRSSPYTMSSEMHTYSPSHSSPSPSPLYISRDIPTYSQVSPTNRQSNAPILRPSLSAMNGSLGMTIPATPISEYPQDMSYTLSPCPCPSPLPAIPSVKEESMSLETENTPDDTLSYEHTSRYLRLESSQDNHYPEYEPLQQLKKVAHNVIERRYRNNINDRICELKNVIPSLSKSSIHNDSHIHTDDEQDNSETERKIDGMFVSSKISKATILRKATDYIQLLQHENQQIEKENYILQQIISQMPGGDNALYRFHTQKRDHQKAEHERLMQQRKLKMENDRIERQRILKERAAQRAALAQLLLPSERQSHKKKTRKPVPKKKEEGKMFMAMFMAMFTAFSFIPPSPPSTLHSPNRHSFSEETPSSTHGLDLWYFIRWCVLWVGLIYFVGLPLLISWLRPHRIKQ
ncbi:hypothetical protein BDF14DRAFT_1750856 [Spinellus fusiger]|nr:hypothetical protein BDF14DRAFT_1750856 [Spinellus fusiger]